MNQFIYVPRIMCEGRSVVLTSCFLLFLFPFIYLHAEEIRSIELTTPVDCSNAKCFIQRMPDQQLGSDYKDYRCESFSSNGYASTDIRVKRASELVKRIPVVASLSGVVDGIRDGMPDGIFTGDKAVFIKGKECGNGVYLAHDNGLKTQYCHLRKGSVKVSKGERVEAGQKLAEMGLSGKTNFPHLEFRLIKNTKAIDPFNGKLIESGCSSDVNNSLWKDKNIEGINLATTHLVSAGFSSKVPSLPGVVLGLYDKRSIPINSKALLFWVEVSGIEKGDVEEFSIAYPDGSFMLRNISKPHKNGRVLYLGYSGKKLSNQLKSGMYTGHYKLVRTNKGNKKVIISAQRTISIIDK